MGDSGGYWCVREVRHQGRGRCSRDLVGRKRGAEIGCGKECGCMSFLESIRAWLGGWSKVHLYHHACGYKWQENEQPFSGYRKPIACPNCKEQLQIAPENVRLFA